MCSRHWTSFSAHPAQWALMATRRQSSLDASRTSDEGRLCSNYPFASGAFSFGFLGCLCLSLYSKVAIQNHSPSRTVSARSLVSPSLRVVSSFLAEFFLPRHLAMIPSQPARPLLLDRCGGQWMPCPEKKIPRKKQPCCLFESARSCCIVIFRLVCLSLYFALCVYLHQVERAVFFSGEEYLRALWNFKDLSLRLDSRRQGVAPD